MPLKKKLHNEFLNEISMTDSYQIAFNSNRIPLVDNQQIPVNNSAYSDYDCLKCKYHK